jgi:malate dehydrogenase (oxaloacetate-decarboxylating)
VAKAAQQDGVAPQMDDNAILSAIDKTFWKAEYQPYKHAAF